MSSPKIRLLIPCINKIIKAAEPLLKDYMIVVDIHIFQLLKQERDKLKVKVENSLYVVQERQAKVTISFSVLYLWVHQNIEPHKPL